MSPCTILATATRHLVFALAVMALGSLNRHGSSLHAADPAFRIVTAEFVYDSAPSPSCHASTIVGTKDGLLAAWFAGTREGDKDVGIWSARHDGKMWTAPIEVADGVQPDGTRHPCWNPVLYRHSGDGVL